MVNMYSPDLVKLDNWLCWYDPTKPINVSGLDPWKPTDKKGLPLGKSRPMNPKHGYPASTTNIEHLASFREATQAAKRFNFGGVSFVLVHHNKIVCIDIDGCIHDGVIAPDAEKIVRWFNTYTTISPSGTGLHLYLYGEIPQTLLIDSSKITELNEKSDKKISNIKGIEVFGWDKALRETGQQVSGTPLLIQSDGGKLKQLYTRLGWQPPRPIQRTNTAPSGTGAVDYACKVMAQTLEGGRNATLNKQAFWLGQLVGGGQLNQSDCEPLKQVALNQGLEPAEVEKTFASGFNDGLLKPIFPKPQKVASYGKRGKVKKFQPDIAHLFPADWPFAQIEKELNELFPEYQPATQPDQQTRLQAYQNGPQTIYQADKVQSSIDSPIADLMALANSLGGELRYTEQFTF